MVEPLRIAVGFSGGVDSAVTAMLLRDAGHHVVGLMMSVKPAASQSVSSADDAGLTGCGAGEDVESARRLAEHIGIQLQVVDCAEAYRRDVLNYFRDEYLAGRTPNPCIRCNPLVKFGVLPAAARAAGMEFDRFATGHYARIAPLPDQSGPALYRGADPAKDQSYFLYRLSSEQLATTMFPLGRMAKDQVRRIAAERGLHVHDKPDSQDFHNGAYAGLVSATAAEGEIVRPDSQVVGTHQGYWNFTPGQRRGLGVAYREPLYVINVVPEKNQVVVSTRAESLGAGCVATDLVFNPAPPEPGTQVLGKLRSAQQLKPMRIESIRRDESGRDTLAVSFAEPIHGVAPGQSLVLYDQDRVIGGGIITEAIRSPIA